MLGGIAKHSSYLSVSMDRYGNMIAGGYTQDETIFVQELREGKDDIQKTAPILAYYPVDNFDDVRVY